jgi:1-acyl-sn-glycerol-3-phosphate acyltransferase
MQLYTHQNKGGDDDAKDKQAKDEEVDEPLTHLFHYSHVRRGAGCSLYCLLALYAPVGLVLASARAFLLIVMASILAMSPNWLWPPWLLRTVALLGFGVVVRRGATTTTATNTTTTTTKAAALTAAATNAHATPAPFVLVANHISAFDVLPILCLQRCNVLVDAGFFKLARGTFSKLMGLLPFSPPSSPSERKALHAQVAAAAVGRDPLLIFCEGWDSRNDRSLLMYRQFAFSLSHVRIRPIALRCSIPCLPLVPGKLGSSLLAELWWLLFKPVMVYTVSMLPVQIAAQNERAAAFARRVQLATAKELGVRASRWSNKDALQLRRFLRLQPRHRQRLLRNECVESDLLAFAAKEQPKKAQ